jgi:hypothetical protein
VIRRLVITVLLGLALFGLLYAFSRPTDNQQPALKDAAVRHVEPPPGDRVLRQAEISVQLDPEYTGVLKLDGNRIPEDQVDHIIGLNQIAFTPGDGKDIKQLSAGHHCATVELWQLTVPDAVHRTFSWCFEVH